MYRTNHFYAGDFSIPHFSDTQAEVGKVHACPGSRLSIVFLHFPEKDIKQGVIFVTVRNIKMEQSVNPAYFLRSTENSLFCLVKRSKQELPCSEQDRDCDDSDETVQRR